LNRGDVQVARHADASVASVDKTGRRDQIDIAGRRALTVCSTPMPPPVASPAGSIGAGVQRRRRMDRPTSHSFKGVHTVMRRSSGAPDNSRHPSPR
jgi:hypothetical protein